MDIPKTDAAHHRRRRRIVYALVMAGAPLAVAVGLAGMRPAAPRVEKALLWTGAVQRGRMLRTVRGVGSLVPEQVRRLPAPSEGRVEGLPLQAGTAVTPDTIVIVLHNPALEQQAIEVESQWRAAEAQYAELKAQLESQRLDIEDAVARLDGEVEEAKLRADVDEELARQGLVADLTHKVSRSRAEILARRHAMERSRREVFAQSARAQLAVQQATVEQRRTLARLKRSQVDALRVRAGIDGVLQRVLVEVGQQVAAGADLARVAQPGRLKAVVQIAETEARDIQPGLPAVIDTRNGRVAATVSRVDPGVHANAVSVDLAPAAELPKGARPDLTVEGIIEIDQIDGVLYIGRPARARENSSLELFRLVDGSEAVRTKVKVGRVSVDAVEVLEGLREGDEVVLSDTSPWDGVERVLLR